MNKKLTLASLLLTAGAGFVMLTAFGPKQDQQKQEIAAAITAKLDEFRAQKEEECTLRVNETAQQRYQEYVASLPPEPAAKPGKTAAKKKPATAKKDPMPEKAPNQGGVARPGATQKDAAPAPVERPGANKKDEAPKPVERPGAKKKDSGGGR